MGTGLTVGGAMVKSCSVVNKCTPAIAWRMEVLSSLNHVCRAGLRTQTWQDASLRQSVRCSILNWRSKET